MNTHATSMFEDFSKAYDLPGRPICCVLAISIVYVLTINFKTKHIAKIASTFCRFTFVSTNATFLSNFNLEFYLKI